MRRVVIYAGLIAFTACGSFEVDQMARCEELNTKLTECFGSEFADYDCEGVSDNDIERSLQTLEDGACTTWGEALPIDGDARASSCRLFADGCVTAKNPAPSRQPTRYPVLLVNGIDASPAFSYSDRIVNVMRDAGHDVHLAIVTPFDTPQRRSVVLWESVQSVLQERAADKVNLICHSLGGLDCRYLVSPGGLHHDLAIDHQLIVNSVASVTTVSTAHRGTRVADAALGFLPDDEVGDALDSLATLFGEFLTERAVEDDVRLRGSLTALSERQAEIFNAEVTDANGIYYQSWGGFSRPEGEATPEYEIELARVCMTDEGINLSTFDGEFDRMATPLVALDAIVSGNDPEQTESVRPHDGLCPIESARWGNFRGCVPADHMEQLGRRNLPDVNVRTHLDIAWWYAEVAADLSRQGY